jgi:hypothetical protein
VKWLLNLFQGWKISWTWPLKSGYNVDEDRIKLKRILDQAVANPNFKSTKNPDGTWKTFCNISLYWIFEQLGWKTILPRTGMNEPLLANDLIGYLRKSGGWKIGTGIEAHQRANAGRPVIAGEIHPTHGHVTHIYPATDMGFSTTLNKKVPFCANVGSVPHRPEDEGKDLNAVEEISRAFPVAQGEPTYFLYVGNVV